jgi:CheY-like chemotaxis protein
MTASFCTKSLNKQKNKMETTSKPDKKNFTILLVDDVAANLKLLGDILIAEGYKIRQVSSGLLALKVTEKEKPDLILLDIMMPGMDGFEVCRQLKQNEQLNDIPIIFISALNDTGNIVEALAAGGVDYINKPFQAQEVLARVDTHLKLRAQSKKLQELNATKDRFFSIIAHDLRGPLGGFMGLTEMMADDNQYFTESEKKEMMSDLSHSARNTFSLLENLLEWSQMDRGFTEFKPKKLYLLDVVTECISIVAGPAKGKMIGLIAQITNEPIVFADKNMIQTVIRNLLSNAIKFTPKGGEVTISAKAGENNRMVISVKDTGIGMREELRNNLFRIDANTKRPGTEGEQSTGLGLLLCKEFVEKHGGEIWVESVPDQGSVFSFTVPVAKEIDEKLEFPDAVEANADPIHNLNVLIAEDDEISARLILAIIKEFCVSVFRVRTGFEAVEFCRNNPKTNLVLMDIAMPFMDGYEATKLIRNFNKEVVIIAQTTFAMTADHEKALASGCNDFITKPFVKDELIKLIGKHIKR